MYFESKTYLIQVDGFDVITAINKSTSKFVEIKYTSIYWPNYKPIDKSKFEQSFNAAKYLENK